VVRSNVVRTTLSMRAQMCGALSLLLAAAGCPSRRRGPNVMMMIAASGVPVTATVGAESELSGAGGVHAIAQAAETLDDWWTVRGRLDLGLGGDARGVAGHATLDAQVGMAFLDGADHPFVRIGVYGTAEADSLTGLYLLEVPTLWLGYQHHGESMSDQWHLDVGPRVVFGAVGSALARGDLMGGGSFDFVAAPGVGGAVLVMGELATFEATYTHDFAAADLDVVRGSVCLAALLAICPETRPVVLAIGEPPMVTGYYGIRLGVGLATGADRLF